MPQQDAPGCPEMPRLARKVDASPSKGRKLKKKKFGGTGAASPSNKQLGGLDYELVAFKN